MQLNNKNNLIVLLAVIVMIISAACSAVAHIEKDETVNFNNYKTFTWVSNKEKSLKARNSNAIVDANVRNEVAKTLKQNGWVEAKSNPDVWLDYNIMVETGTTERSEPVYSRAYTRYYYNPYARRIITVYHPSQMVGYETYEVPYKEGTITLHMIDNKTDKLIWQGWTTNEVNSRNLTSKEVVNSVKTILKKFKTEG